MGDIIPRGKGLVREAVKYDDEKLRTDLLPINPVLEVCKVLTYGAKKYADRNWEKGFEWSRPYGATLRHIWAWWNGEDLDPESSLHHLAHAICELMFLMEFVTRKTGRDNRPCFATSSTPTEKTRTENQKMKS